MDFVRFHSSKDLQSLSLRVFTVLIQKLQCNVKRIFFLILSCTVLYMKYQDLTKRSSLTGMNDTSAAVAENASGIFSNATEHRSSTLGMENTNYSIAHHNILGVSNSSNCYLLVTNKIFNSLLTHLRVLSPRPYLFTGRKPTLSAYRNQSKL